MKEARETIKKAIETIEEMNAKYCEKYGVADIEEETLKPFWCYCPLRFDKVVIYKEYLAMDRTIAIDERIVKDALEDIKNRKYWEIALEEGRA